MPFSDPLADGPVIQRATERALASGTTLSGVLDMVGRLTGRRARADSHLQLREPDPAARRGAVRRPGERPRASTACSCSTCRSRKPTNSGRCLASRGIDTILLLSPTTTDDRLRRAAALGSGFLYAISRLGVTGARDAIADGAEEMVRRIRTVSPLPIALGFGISKPEHVREVGRWADAAVVGSALVSVIAEAGASADLNARVEEYVRWLKS